MGEIAPHTQITQYCLLAVQAVVKSLIHAFIRRSEMRLIQQYRSGGQPHAAAHCGTVTRHSHYKVCVCRCHPQWGPPNPHTSQKEGSNKLAIHEVSPNRPYQPAITSRGATSTLSVMPRPSHTCTAGNAQALITGEVPAPRNQP